MSLADLPIENIAHIQCYLASNITKFDTCLLRACRAIREKALAYIWPLLYVDEISAHVATMISIYKFAKIYVRTGGWRLQVLKSLRPDLNVETLMEYNDLGHREHKRIENGRIVRAISSKMTTTVRVNDPTSLTIIGRHYTIHAAVGYDLTIIATNHSREMSVYLRGVLPTWIKWRSSVGSPYVHHRMATDSAYKNNRAIVYGSNDELLTVMCVHQPYFSPTKSVSVMKELPEQYRNIFSSLAWYEVVSDIIDNNYGGIYDEQDLYAIKIWLHSGAPEPYVKSTVNIDAVVSTVKAELIKKINEA